MAEPGRASREWWVTRGVASLLVPVAAFLALRPESFGLTPNGLDPFFYTGYAINLDDMLRELGDRWYFVTRWSTYYPSFLFTEALGAVVGRLVLRLVLASAMLLALWHLGRRWRWTIQVELVVGIVAVTMPMFARAFLTDYNQFLVVSLGTVFVAQCLEPRRSPPRTASIGVLAALLLVANPQTFSVVALPVVAYALWPWDRWTRVGRRIALVAVSASITLAFGFLLFRAYGIPNVYAPTIDFIQTHSSYHDPLKSPRPTWLYDFTWLYGPPLVLAVVAFAPGIRRAFMRDRIRLTVVGLFAAQTLWQWVNQFLLDRASLELEYYWAYIYPLFAVMLATVIALDRGLRWRSVAVFIGVWYLALIRPTWTGFTLPSGWGFLVLAASIVTTAAALSRYSLRSTWVALVVFLVLTQVAAPPYAPPATHPYNVDPHYDRIYFHPNSTSVLQFGEARWLARELDSLPDDSRLSFVAIADAAEAIVAIYGAQVTDALVHAEPGTCKLDGRVVREVRAGLRPRLALYGPPERVETCLRASKVLAARSVLDATNPGDLGFRLVVLEPTEVTGSISWTAAELLSQVGRVDGSSRVASPDGTDGFVVFGPYVRLTRGTWKATLVYRSSAPPDVGVGVFDVATKLGSDSRGSATIPGTGGATRSVMISFRVDDPVHVWEFRVRWNGVGELRTDRVSVRHAS